MALLLGLIPFVYEYVLYLPTTKTVRSGQTSSERAISLYYCPHGFTNNWILRVLKGNRLGASRNRRRKGCEVMQQLPVNPEYFSSSLLLKEPYRKRLLDHTLEHLDSSHKSEGTSDEVLFTLKSSSHCVIRE